MFFGFFSFNKVVTNKNPLYPELVFEDVVLKNKNGDIIFSNSELIRIFSFVNPNANNLINSSEK